MTRCRRPIKRGIRLQLTNIFEKNLYPLHKRILKRTRYRRKTSDQPLRRSSKRNNKTRKHKTKFKCLKTNRQTQLKRYKNKNQQKCNKYNLKRKYQLRTR